MRWPTTSDQSCANCVRPIVGASRLAVKRACASVKIGHRVWTRDNRPRDSFGALHCRRPRVLCGLENCAAVELVQNFHESRAVAVLFPDACQQCRPLGLTAEGFHDRLHLLEIPGRRFVGRDVGLRQGSHPTAADRFPRPVRDGTWQRRRPHDHPVRSRQNPIRRRIASAPWAFCRTSGAPRPAAWRRWPCRATRRSAARAARLPGRPCATAGRR